MNESQSSNKSAKESSNTRTEEQKKRKREKESKDINKNKKRKFETSKQLILNFLRTREKYINFFAMIFAFAFTLMGCMSHTFMLCVHYLFQILDK